MSARDLDAVGLDAVDLDAGDPLAAFRDEFHLLPDTIYMDGNSLGLASKPALAALHDVAEAWKGQGIDGWLGGAHPWYHLSERLGAMAAPFLGAQPREVAIAGSVSVNLHQVLATFFKPHGARTKILIEEAAFPTDAYAVKSHLALHGLDPADHLVVVPSAGGTALDEDAVVAALNGEIALAVLPVVLYRTGQLLDTRRIALAAQACGALLCLDACHSFGAMAHAWHDDGVDAGIFCTYKYGNGGPGAAAGLFVHEKHLGTRPGLPGWFSSRKDKQFDMDDTLVAAEEAGAYQIGTPNILSMAPLLGAFDQIARAGIDRIRAKSLALTGYMIERIDAQLDGLGFTIATPREAARRGGHVALRHAEAARICKALKDARVIPDFRPPDIVRLSPAPLYGSFAEVAETVRILRDIAVERRYLAYPNVRDLVA
ncbi:MAG: kynureninase [Alphaproteobacteria bacterium]|nr:kynureninase [Alphaproteobacteria bacterium]